MILIRNYHSDGYNFGKRYSVFDAINYVNGLYNYSGKF